MREWEQNNFSLEGNKKGELREGHEHNAMFSTERRKEEVETEGGGGGGRSEKEA